MARELERASGRCALCGARAGRAGAGAAGGGGRLAARAFSALFARETKSRSGLAYAAGFAGLVYLFTPSAAALASEWLGLSGLLVAYLWGASAPAAMALGLAAAAELDSSPRAAGRAQALLGYLVGLWGTLRLVAEAQWWFRSHGP
ncbi:MAG TPA: hypothetical protein VG148_16025 [Pyrinomonadaceae bacterium]|nr:hypothetical protein [Pyrinomonadaceae bacterium]